MLLGLATYLYGYRYLPARVVRLSREGGRLAAAERSGSRWGRSSLRRSEYARFRT